MGDTGGEEGETRGSKVAGKPGESQTQGPGGEKNGRASDCHGERIRALKQREVVVVERGRGGVNASNDDEVRE